MTKAKFVLLIIGLLTLFIPPMSLTAQDDPTSDDLALDAARDVIQLMRDGQGDILFEHFTPEVQAALSADQAAMIWNQLEAQAGAYVRELAAVVNHVEGYQQVVLTLEFESTAATGAAFDAVVVFDAERCIAGLNFRPNFNPPLAEATPEPLPDYVNADAFTESDVTVGEGMDFPLPGTLSMPSVGDGALVPAVVLVHGSGPNDRDGTVGPNKVLRDVAWGLASSGIAALRYDKRTLVHGAQMAALTNLTIYEETIEDAVRAVELLHNTPGIDPERIYIFGHSLGGLAAPRIAQAADAAGVPLAGIIVASGALEGTLDQEISRQIRYLAELDGEISDEEQAAIDAADQVAAAVSALDENSDLNALLFAVEEGETLDPTLAAFNSPASYWYDMRQYDPLAAALAIDVPMLVLQGERDYQATMDGFTRWQTALANRGQTTFISYPALNHLLIAGEGAPNNQEYLVPSHVDAGLIGDVVTWIKGQ